MNVRTLRGCAPFVVCGVVSAFTEWRTGTLIALTLSVILLLDGLRSGNGLGEAFLEASAAVFCAVAVVVAFSVPTAPIKGHIGTISVGWQALTAWGSLASRRPFTLGGARRAVSEAVGRDPAFVRVHMVIVSIWAAAFTATAVALAVLETVAPHSGVLEIVIQLVGNLVPAVFAHRYEVAAVRSDQAFSVTIEK
jgi:hypothetical protein